RRGPSATGPTALGRRPTGVKGRFSHDGGAGALARGRLARYGARMTQALPAFAQNARFDVCALGNAIVDVLAPCEPAFLEAKGLVPGSMQLVDEDQSAALYDAMAAGVEAS